MFIERFRNQLTSQKAQGLYRNPRAIDARRGKYLTSEGKTRLSFAGNDYLGLAQSLEFSARVARNFEKYGTSSSSSRLVTGNFALLNEAEQAFAEYFGYDDALFFPSGYQCNLGVLSTLFRPEDTVFYDKHIHASSVKGIVLSGAVPRGFNHNSIAHLERRLKSSDAPQLPVVTESLFSMDGDFLDVSGLERLKARQDLFCVVDEAHAFGALGPGGRGIARDVADVAVGTLGKAMALFGAFVLMPKGIKEYLMNFSSALIYSTTLPEAHAASCLDLLTVLERADSEREKLARISRCMKDRLTEKGFTVGGDAHILAVTMGDETRAVRVAQRLYENGILAFPARFPTVPLGQAILRVGMTACHDGSDVDLFVEKLVDADKE